MPKTRPNGRRYRKIASKHHNEKCVICGVKKDLTVHHVDGDCWNNRPYNLVWLCRSCHDLVDFNKRQTAISIVKAYSETFKKEALCL